MKPRCLLPLLLIAACADGASPTLPEPDLPAGTTLTLATSEELVFEAGATSPTPIRVRATADGMATTGVRVEFDLPPDLGRLSQTIAPTDAEGWAETWVLDARPGTGAVVASLGGARAARDIRILRAPGVVEIDPSPGRVGRPGFTHPDSIVRARVLDTEGRPMAGEPVFFAWSGEEVVGVDTTDAEGWATGVLGASPPGAGEWPAFALLPGRPINDADPRVTEPVAGRLVVVAIDGLPGYALEALAPPTLTGLAAGGAVARRMRSIEPTLSVPANLSMLAGEGPESHQLFSEELEFTPEMNRLDPLFRIGLRRGLATAAVLAEEGHLARFDEILECRLAFGFDRLLSAGPGADAVIDSTLPLLAEDGPEMIYLHLSDPDVAGHAEGWGSDSWREAVLETDAALSRLVAALPSDAVLAVHAAHGGGGGFGRFQHGSTAPSDVEVPLLLYGAGVARGVVLDEVDLLDLAPTLGWTLGWGPSERWTGALLLDGFGGTRARQSGPNRP